MLFLPYIFSVFNPLKHRVNKANPCEFKLISVNLSACVMVYFNFILVF